MKTKTARAQVAPGAETFRIVRILRPHWKPLVLALIAVVGETTADVLEPWPITIVVDNILQGKRLARPLSAAVVGVFGQNTSALLQFALASVLLIAIVGGVSAYVEKYLTTSVSQWVAHDLRLLLYQRIQRLSLAEHGKSRAGDLITRVTKDIDAVQDFIDTALLGILVNLMTLVGMIGIMLYVNWRFTLVGLSVAPVLGLFVYFYSRKIKEASRSVKKKESELLSGVAEVLTSIQVVQAFAREDYEDRRFKSESRRQCQRRPSGAKRQGEAVADGRRHRRDRHLSGAGLRCQVGFGGTAEHRRPDRFPDVFEEDV